MVDMDIDDSGAAYFGLEMVNGPIGTDYDAVFGRISANISEITWVH